ncbi:RNA polymerase sigma factor [Alicyclobacillus sp. SO9]|uniref:RNA polymerase sigma factor n=1 Tax=Alicyclobacillus sp. SO9 TaxID=2665646 RepID=UPI0018E780A3|nr:RNA polymerase sigma factor [Alicyclobacillus sp. SO9]QQE79746.1 RNA polymerase sigma factor [Alicyclobacillus sp. SO9]
MTHEEQKRMLHELYERHYRDVYRYARYLLGSHEEALDAVQETFLRAFRGIHSFKQKSTIKTWLLSITRHYAIDYLRKHGVSSNKHSSLSDHFVMADPTRSSDMKMEIENALKCLKHDYRQVFILRNVMDLSVRDTAAILRWSESKVRTTLHRSNMQMREFLGVDMKGGASHRV